MYIKYLGALAVVGTGLASIACAFAAGGTPASTLAATQGLLAEVPLQLHQGRTAIHASINGGAPQLVIFDTGSQGATIRQSAADRLGLQVVGEVLLGSPGGSAPIPAKVVQFERLSVGDVDAQSAPRSLDAVIVEDARFKVDADIVIGNNQFPHMLIEMDFVAKRFRLRSAPAQAGEDWQATDQRGLLATTLQVAATKVPAYIDSGNAGFLDLPNSMADELALASALRESTPIRLVDRELKTQSAAFDGEILIAGTPVHVRRDVRFAELPFANVGVQAMQGTVLRIDTANRRWQWSFSARGTPTLGGTG
jgi:hypothetical protein